MASLNLATMTDRITHLLRPLRQLWGPENAAPEIHPPISLEDRAQTRAPIVASGDLVTLDRILIILARSFKRSEPIRLMTRRMSLREIQFQTRWDLDRGQELHLQMLLEPGFALQVHARVAEAAWIEGECRGRLTLSCGPFERGALTSYLSKRNIRPV